MHDTEHHVSEGRLASTGGAHKCHGCSGWDFAADLDECRLQRVVVRERGRIDDHTSLEVRISAEHVLVDLRCRDPRTRRLVVSSRRTREEVDHEEGGLRLHCCIANRDACTLHAQKRGDDA